MSLVSKFKVFFLSVEVLLILLNSFTFIFISLLRCFLGRLDLLKKVVISLKEFLSVNFTDLTKWNVWNLMFETTMDKYIVARGPARVSESLNTIELIPLRRFGIINFEGNNFTYLVSSSSNDHHEGSEE